MGYLTLSFFGAFQTVLGEKPLANFRSVKIQGLLIYLILSPQQAHSRDVLATLFWPDEPETTAKQNLRQSLYRLRQLLGDTDSQKRPYLLVTRSTVQFNPTSDYSLDVADFLAALEQEDLETAVSRYQGELLPGFSCDSLPFDDWLRQERERLHRLALDTLYQLTSRSFSQADFQKAQRFARKQLALEPWREEAHRQLMEALASLGERTAALGQYETCRTVLAEELGVEPSPETADLAKRIRNARLAWRTKQQSANSIEHPQLKIPFVGRKAEYEALVKAYRRVSQHGLQLVTVQGKAGIGKTRLTEQFVSWAATQGADLLVGRSFVTSAGLSYQPITHLLRQRLERENAPDDLLSDLWLSQLTRLLPELRDRYPDLPEPTQEENTARQHLFEAVTRLIQALAARQTLVLFIDDWHWADSASLDLLHYAAVRWSEAELPILIVLTLRQEAVSESADLQSWLTKLNHATNRLPLQVSELSQPETEQLIQLLVPSKRDEVDHSLTKFADWLFAETDGQPLFLSETLKALVEDGLVQANETTAAWQIDWSKFDEQGASSRILHGVQEIIQGWLERVTPQAKALLTSVSILEQDATFDHLCRVAGLDEMGAIEALDDLLNKQLLVETDQALPMPNLHPIYSFYHQKVSEVVYAEAGTARRRLLHRRAFETLQASKAAAADLAHHTLKAGLVAETIQYSLIAGNEAMALFAVRVAITHYETAWQVAEQKGWPEAISGADRQALYMGLGRAYELIESWDKAEETYKVMIAYAQSIESAAMECLGLNHLATIYYLIFTKIEQAAAFLERALTIAKQSGDRRGMAETVWNLAMAAFKSKDLALALHHSKQALGIARNLEHPQLMARCFNLLSYIYTAQRKWDKVAAYTTEASQLYRNVGNLVLAADSQRLLGYSQKQTGRLQESLTTLQETAAFSQQIENLWGQVESARMLASVWLELGNYGQAIQLSRQSVRQSHQVGHHPLTMWATITWGTVQRTIMAVAAAQETFLALLAEDQDDFRSDWLHEELCIVFALAGDWEAAYRYSRLALASRKDDPILPAGLSTRYETEALLRGGNEALARAEVERLREIVGNNKRYRLILLRSQAVLAQWDGDLDQAITYLQAALALAQEIGLPGEEWPILGELGGLHLEQGEKQKARQSYQDAAVIIRRLAETIDEEDLRTSFLAADQVRSVLEMSKGV